MGTAGDPSNGNTFKFSELAAVNGRYFPMSNACGQFGLLYSEKGTCSSSADGDGFNNNTSGVDMSCEVDTSLEIEAAPHPRYNYPSNAQGDRRYGPPPFYCGPKRRYQRFAGYWDEYSQEFVRDVAYPSALGKMDVEG